MKTGSLVIGGMRQDEIFDLESKLNRDNGFLVWKLLKDRFGEQQIQLHTSDINAGRQVDFAIHLDARVHPEKSIPSYLLMLETPQVCPENGVGSRLDRFARIFTWNDNLVDGERFIKINFPNVLCSYPSIGFTERDHFCCMIAGNKSLSARDDRDLYIKRVDAIRWFEQNAPDKFDLYGTDWDLPSWGRGAFGKITRRFMRMLSRVIELHPFPSYRGRISSKRDVLTRTRYAICYENVSDLPGYITEKIFDCFISGCVPVYWGARNITNHIPAGCFIDRRDFRDTGEVFNFLQAITEREYAEYQSRIAEFLASEAAYPFGNEYFVETIVTTVVKDIGSQA